MPPDKKLTPEALARQAETRRKINDLLEEAIAQRPKFHLSFDAEVSTLKNVTAALYSHDYSGIVLELTGVKGVSRRWQNEIVTVYFEIVDRALKQGIFYTFESLIVDIQEKEGGRFFLHLSYPLDVDRSQRRKSLRVTGDLEYIDLFTMWVYDSSGKFDLNNPFMTLEDFSTGVTKLENISAGGVRILFTPAFLQRRSATISAGMRFIMSVKVKETRCPGDKDAWLIARVNNFYENPLTRHVEAGIEFIAEGKINPNNKVVWKKVAGNIVENVGAWTYTWYLQQIR